MTVYDLFRRLMFTSCSFTAIPFYFSARIPVSC